jgi:hypothetical protein
MVIDVNERLCHPNALCSLKDRSIENTSTVPTALNPDVRRLSQHMRAVGCPVARLIMCLAATSRVQANWPANSCSDSFQHNHEPGVDVSIVHPESTPAFAGELAPAEIL